MKRHPNVANLDEVDTFTPPSPGPPPFKAGAKRLASATGGKRIGANYFQVPAGHTAVPMHAHHNNEEAIFVLKGRGTLRIGSERVGVRPSDWISLPAGAEYAHQLLADQGEELSYLVISTMNEADIITYPDSDKVLAVVGSPATGFRKMFRLPDGNVGYWEGEGDAAKKG
jgi:uncharacterized cupin superfamily protein